MHLRIWSPLPPVRSGTADYAAQQIKEFSKYFDVSVITPQDISKIDPDRFNACCRITSPENLDWNANHVDYFHLANNEHHRYVYEAALEHPGFHLVHDGSLHHLVTHMTLGEGRKLEYLKSLEANHGDVGRFFAFQRFNGRYTDELAFRLRLLRKPLEKSLGVVAHSRWIKEQIWQINPHLPVRHVFHHIPVVKQIGKAEQIQAKQQLKIHPDEFVLGCIGFATKPKRIDIICKAASEAALRGHKVCILVAGEIEDPRVRDALAECPDSVTVKVLGYVDEEVFATAIKASDLVSSLRYPTTGETSGVLMNALGYGRIPLVFSIGSFSDFDKDLVVQVPLNDEAHHVVAATIERLISSAQEKQAQEARVLDFAQRCSVEWCVKEISEFLNSQTTYESAAEAC